MINKQPPLIAIVGQTASGKSRLALEVALKHGGEIICADSRTVYKGMDIGTAKPSSEDQEKVPHHGLNLVAPNERFSAGQYKEYAAKIIDQIRRRGKLSVLVGGTGLYIDGVLFDYSFDEVKDTKKRRHLDNMELKELQKEARNIEPNLTNSTLHNKRHLVRIIERGAVVEDRKSMPANTLIIGIQPARKIIRHNIESRVELMFKRGLRHEVEALVAKYGWGAEAMTGIGYREFKPYYEADISMAEVKRSIVQNTLHYAKRQRTWFKRNPFIEWFESSESAQERISEFIAASGYTK